jgi:hypothetical protein
MNNLTKKQSNEITNLYEMLSNGWHYTNSPNYHKFMKAHNDLQDYKSN